MTTTCKFMECNNLGNTTVKYAICAPKVLLKLLENQIATNFICLTSEKSHINY